ncbi:MAG: M48 family metallopeptidase [Desulfuromonadia bacterium]
MSFLRLLLFLLLLPIHPLLTGCATTPNDIHGFNIISIDEEKGMGDRFAAEIEKQYTVVRIPELQRYLDSMGGRLLSGVREVRFPYTFTVVQDDTLNAFAIPGGHVYIHTGLIRAARSEHELAGVLAHEINHVVARHGTRQMTQEYGYGLLLQIVLGNNPGMLTQMAANLFGKAGAMSYSRSMETQADLLAIETMVRAGYDPEGLLSFFTLLQGTTKENPSKLARYFSSHPPTSERIQLVRAEIQKQGRGIVRENRGEFERIKRLAR